MYRIGLGHDTHRLVAGRPLILGGVRVEHSRGLDGHSDADIVLHALTDALLGAVAAGDIGELFPDTDPANRGLDSRIFLGRAVQIVRQSGYALGNVDIIIFAQEPKFGAHKRAIRDSVAALLGVEPGRVSVKAKTGEKVGHIGRAEAMACQAVVLVVKSDSDSGTQR